MYINEGKAADLLNISRMQLRFIIASGDYDFYIDKEIYYLNVKSLIKIEVDMDKSRKNFKSIMEEFYDK